MKSKCFMKGDKIMKEKLQSIQEEAVQQIRPLKYRKN